MKLQKFILCVVAALAAFGVSLGLFEIAGYLRPANRPAKIDVESAAQKSAATIRYSPITPDYQRVHSNCEESEPEIEPEDYSDHGDYYIIGEIPKGFEDFKTLSIVTRVYSDIYPDGIAAEQQGSVYTTDKEFKFTWISIFGNRISIVTQAKRGVSYQFDGKFVEEKVLNRQSDGEEYEEKVVLKGRLTKWRGGVKIAEAKTRFVQMCGY